MWIASRTGSLPRKAKETLETPPEICANGSFARIQRQAFDEVDGVVVVLFDAGGDSEDVGIEDDVLGRETDSR